MKNFIISLLFLSISLPALAQLVPVTVAITPLPGIDSVNLNFQAIKDKGVLYYDARDSSGSTSIFAYSTRKDSLKEIHSFSTTSSGWNNRFMKIDNRIYYAYNNSASEIRLAEFNDLTREGVHKSTLNIKNTANYVAGDKRSIYMTGTGNVGYGIYVFNTNNGQFRTLFVSSGVYISRLGTHGDSALFVTNQRKAYLGSSFNNVKALDSNKTLSGIKRYGKRSYLYDYRGTLYNYTKGDKSLTTQARFGSNSRIYGLDSLENGLFIRVYDYGTRKLSMYRVDDKKDTVTLLDKTGPDSLLANLTARDLGKGVIGVLLTNEKLLVYDLIKNETKTYDYPLSVTVPGWQSVYRKPVYDNIQKKLYFIGGVPGSSTQKKLYSLSKDGSVLDTLSDTLNLSKIWQPKELYIMNGEVYFFSRDKNGLALKKFSKKVFKLKLNCFNDANANGKRDQGETSINQMKVELNAAISELTSGLGGNIEMLLEVKKYDLKAFAPDKWKFTTDSTFTINQSEAKPNETLTLDLGISPKKSVYEIDGTLSGLPTRCGFYVWTRPKIINSGTKAFSGEMRMTMDTMISIDSFGLNPDSTLGNEYVWLFDNIDATHFRAARAYFRVPGVQFRGRKIKIDITFRGHGSNNEVVELVDSFRPEINCSYDPNDKTVWPNRDDLGNQTQFDEKLTYRIRFQNTGSDTAFNIMIADTLSEYLDWSTFKVLDYSHPVETKFYDNGLVQFYFNNVLLPDSNVNEPESHGFVTYTIKAKKGLDEQTEIKNTAHIFFDFNPAIVTNTTNNVMVSEIIYDFVPKPRVVNSLNVYPNPAHDQLTIALPEAGQAVVSVISLNGQTIEQHNTNARNPSLTTTHLPDAIYIIKVVQNGKVYRTRFVKQ